MNSGVSVVAILRSLVPLFPGSAVPLYMGVYIRCPTMTLPSTKTAPVDWRGVKAWPRISHPASTATTGLRSARMERCHARLRCATPRNHKRYPTAVLRTPSQAIPNQFMAYTDGSVSIETREITATMRPPAVSCHPVKAMRDAGLPQIIGKPISGRNRETAAHGGLRPGTQRQSRFGRWRRSGRRLCEGVQGRTGLIQAATEPIVT